MQTVTTTRNQRGFTLVEMIVTITVIVLLAGMTLPVVSKLFSSGAEMQAYNLLAAQIAAARAQAIQQGTYAGVHVQPGDATPDLREAKDVYSAVIVFNKTSGKFDLAPGFELTVIRGHYGFGDIDYLEGAGSFDDTAGEYGFDNFDEADDFTRATIVFSPEGRLVRQVIGGKDLDDDPTGLIVLDPTGPAFSGDLPIWTALEDNDDLRGGAASLVQFNYLRYTKFKEANDLGGLSEEFNKTGMIMAINQYTGELFPRE